MSSENEALLTVDDLRRSRDLATNYLGGIVDRDWSTHLPDVDFDIAGVCAHMTQANYWYAIDFAARGADVTAVVPEIKSESPPPDLILALDVGVDVLAAVIQAAPPSARGFHPFGQADGVGFAAMACDEVLIHTNDISNGVATTFEPPADLAAKVLARLFPWVGGDEDPWTLLLWANGRIALPGRPRLTKWRWHCAPLDEWDGAPPIIDI